MNTKNLALITACLLAGFVSGCATSGKPVQMGDEERANIVRSGEVTAVHQRPIGFHFQTPSGALVSAGKARWNDASRAPNWYNITEIHKVPDFATSIQEKFLSIVGTGNSPYRFKPVAKPLGIDEDENFEGFSQYGTPYVLVFRTRNGVLVYQLTAWNTYKMSYNGEAALVRVSDKEVVWRGGCQIANDRDPVQTVPGKDFLAGNGEKLRAAALYIQRTCAEELAAQFTQSKAAQKLG